jgi:hypothetical protein
MPLTADQIVSLAKQLRDMGIARFKWGELELVFVGGNENGPGESIPLTNPARAHMTPAPVAPNDPRYESALYRMAGLAT